MVERNSAGRCTLASHFSLLCCALDLQQFSLESVEYQIIRSLILSNFLGIKAERIENHSIFLDDRFAVAVKESSRIDFPSDVTVSALFHQSFQSVNQRHN